MPNHLSPRPYGSEVSDSESAKTRRENARLKKQVVDLREACQWALNDLVENCEIMGMNADDDPLVEKLRAVLGVKPGGSGAAD